MDIVKLLIGNFKDSIDINLQNKVEIGMTAFIRACFENDIELVKLLIDNFKDSIDINLVDDDGNTALHCAFRKDNTDLVKLLFDNFKEQIDIKLVNKFGDTILYKACYNENIGILKLLIDNFREQIDINFRDEYGRTALHFAGGKGNVEIIKLLIDNFKDSMDIMLLDNNNTPAWYIYLVKYRSDFKKLFLPLLLNREKSKDPHGLSPLHIAYLLRNNQDDGEEILQYLLNELPELVELDGLQSDKFQSLPHQVTPLPARDYYSDDEDSDDLLY